MNTINLLAETVFVLGRSNNELVTRPVNESITLNFRVCLYETPKS